jgi:hypothetical protein
LEPYADGTPTPTLVTKEVDMSVTAHFLLGKSEVSRRNFEETKIFGFFKKNLGG